jgi:hypothetical protein
MLKRLRQRISLKGKEAITRNHPAKRQRPTVEKITNETPSY